MHIVHILYRFGSFGIVLVGLVKGPTGIILQVNCFVLRSTKQFTYRMILVFHWNDDSAKRPESF